MSSLTDRKHHGKTSTMLSLLLFLSLPGTAIDLHAQESEADPQRLTLDRIFSSGEFHARGFGGARWLEKNRGYTRREPSQGEHGGQDLVRYDPETGDTTILVKAAELIPEGDSRPLAIADYQWSEDGSKLLIFTNTRRVWRRNTRGDYWVLDLDNRSLRQLGADANPSTLMFAKFSPDGTRAAYVRENNLYAENISNGSVVTLTDDGSETIVNGTSDWVNEEEFNLRDGFRWSPDSSKIAYWQFDTEGVGTFHLINNTNGLYPSLTPIRYPKVGETNSACRVGVIDASGGETTWMDVTGDPRNHYIPRMEWADNSDELVIQHLNRLQNTNNVLLCDVDTGKTRTVFTDRDDAWVEVCDDLKWLNDGGHFTFVSERDGWKHVYLVSRDGTEVSLLTPGDYDAISIECIDEEGGFVYFIASPDNPTQRYLFRVPLDGSGELEKLSPMDQAGTHSYQVSPDAKHAFHTWSTINTPPVSSLVRLPEHEIIRVLVDNEELGAKLKTIARLPTEFFKIDIGDGVLLDGWRILPPDFDPEKKYPLFFYVYGEPAGSTVRDQWGGGGYLWRLMLAQNGYVVVSIDNRGTAMPRGRDWRKSIYRQIGILASADQAAATRSLLEQWPFLDADRIGIQGWSGGGSMSLNAIFRYPDLYSTAIAIAVVSNQRFYDTIYQERYMGLPEDNEEGFEQGSPVTFAHQLEGNLLLIHGTGDDNCHYQNFEALVNELVEHGKQFTMMSYPNRSHGIHEGKGTTRHLYELVTRYLMEKMPPGPAR